jgi:hypothetical protein
MARKRAARPKPSPSAKKPANLQPDGYAELLGQIKERASSRPCT